MQHSLRWQLKPVVVSLMGFPVSLWGNYRMREWEYFSLGNWRPNQPPREAIGV